MNFAIGVPTINRGMDLFLGSLIAYTMFDFPNTDIYIIDNGNQGLDKELDKLNQSFIIRDSIHIIVEDKNIGVAASWNKLCRMIYEKYENALILNDDIYLGCTDVDIEKLILKNKGGFIQATNTWAAFIINKSVFEKVGDFDEGFYPAYFEDNDYVYRMKLAKVAVSKKSELVPKNMKHSSSIAKDPALNKNFLKLKKRYIEKWGGEPEREKFKTPFNR